MGWDNSHAPALHIAPGETVEFKDIDATCKQIQRDSTVEIIAKLDFGSINPIAGPVYVDGAEPGDALEVTLLGFEPESPAMEPA